MSDDTVLKFCPRCGVPIVDPHESSDECIFQLKASLAKQNKAAEGLAFEVSTRFFGILEELAHDPSVAGVPFYTYNHDTGEKTKLNNQIVVGVMTAILREYQAAGDWSPLQDVKKSLAEYREQAHKLFGMLQEALSMRGKNVEVFDSFVKRAFKALDEAKQHGVHLSDHDRF